MACRGRDLAPKLNQSLINCHLTTELLIFLPIPFGNSIPAFAVMVMALGMMLGDGVPILSGILVSMIALLIAIAIVALSFEIVTVLFA